MVTVPGALALTSPRALTVASAVLLEDQVSALLLAVTGDTVALSVKASSGYMDAGGALIAMDETIIGVIVIVAEPVIALPSCAVAVIVADPGKTPVMMPPEFTVAMPVLEEDQTTVGSEAPAGVTTAVAAALPST
jgi:hypothetical protein